MLVAEKIERKKSIQDMNKSTELNLAHPFGPIDPGFSIPGNQNYINNITLKK